VLRSVEEVFFSKVSGKIIPEIFEKSIDKHKIDAILNAPSFANGLFGGCLKWAGETGGFHGRIRLYHPDTACELIRRELLCL
jgi:hypothetical protein